MRVSCIVQRSLSPPGGGNAVAAWMVHALAAEHDVGHAHRARRGRPPETNAFYGTAIPASGSSSTSCPRHGDGWPGCRSIA